MRGAGPTPTQTSPGTRWTAHLDDAPVAIAAGGRGAARRLAVAGAGGLLTLLDVDGAVTATAAVDGGLLVAGWSSDGTALALGGPDGAWAWNPDDGLYPLHSDGWCGVLAWHDADRVAVGAGRRAVVLDTMAGGLRPAWATPEAASTVTTLNWLRQGRELAVGAYGGVRAYSRGRDLPARDLAYAGSLLAADATADGRWLVSGNQDASIHVWRLRDGAELEMAGFPRKVTVVAFDPAGRWLAANGAQDSTVWDFSGKGPGGTSPRLLTQDSDEGATALAWHPRLPVLATGGRGSVAAWWVPGASVGRPQAPGWSAPCDAPVGALTWLDDSTLAIATRDGAVTAIGVPTDRLTGPSGHRN